HHRPTLTPFSSHYTAPATSATHTLSLHDALPICSTPSRNRRRRRSSARRDRPLSFPAARGLARKNRRSHTRGRRHQRARALMSSDRKSTRLNSSHLGISYAVFCLKKKNKNKRSMM